MKYDIIEGQWDSFINDNNEYDLIYLDPPFFTQRKHKMEKENGEVSFDDFWENLEEHQKLISMIIHLKVVHVQIDF